MGVWNSGDTGNVTIFKVVKNFSCWTVIVSVVLTVCKIAHKHSSSYNMFFLLVLMFALMLVLSCKFHFTYFSDADRIPCFENYSKRKNTFIYLTQFYCDARGYSDVENKNKKSINLF